MRAAGVQALVAVLLLSMLATAAPVGSSDGMAPEAPMPPHGQGMVPAVPLPAKPVTATAAPLSSGASAAFLAVPRGAAGPTAATSPLATTAVPAPAVFPATTVSTTPAGRAAPASARAVPNRDDALMVSPFTCPGLSGGACGLDCQRTTCEALAAFFRATFNASKPWTRARPSWEVVIREPCSRIVPAAASPVTPPAYCRWYGISCCTPGSMAARRCSALHSVNGIVLKADNVNGSLSDPALMDAVEQLHACGLTVLDLESNDVGGRVLPRWGRFSQLTVFNMANNWLSGTIPPELARLKRLTYLGLDTNFLQGTLGSWIGGLEQLQVLTLGSNMGINAPDPDTGEELAGIMGTVPASVASLRQLWELNLQTNSFSGTIPHGLCWLGSALHVLSLRGNRLSGSADEVTRCAQLVSLDLSSNQFTGSLPATPDWGNLVSLLLNHNNFTGELPEAIYQVPVLSYLDISNNGLTGMLDDRISLLVMLITFDAGGNRLSGQLTEDMFFLPQLTSLNLAGNLLTGTITPSLGLAFGLRDVAFTGNRGLMGQLPDEAGGLPYLRRINLQNTSMNCMPNEEALAALAVIKAGGSAPPYRCPANSLLPCFLEFDAYDAPRSDDSHMRCHPLRRKSPEAASKSCSPAIQALLQEQAATVASGGAADAGGSVSEQWDLPPAYYQYQGCSCMHGWKDSWSSGGTELTCIPDRQLLEPWAWVLVALGGVLFLLCAALLLVASRWVLFRSRWVREAELKRKRARWGSLKAGARLSVVVTDVEGYSELIKTCPHLTRKAVAMHNAVMRKAVHDQAGHIFEQEGDSWAVAFHEAKDAVAFCLQVQQALHKVDWPLGLMASRTGTEDDPYAGSGGSMTEASPSPTLGSHSKSMRQLLGVGSLGVMMPPGTDSVPGQQLGALSSISSKAGLSRESSASTSNPSGIEAASAAAAALVTHRSSDLSAGGRRPMRTDSAGPPVSRMASEPLSLSGSSFTAADVVGNGSHHGAAAAAAAALRAQGSSQATAFPGNGTTASAPVGSGTRRGSRAAQSRFFSMLRPGGSGSEGRLLYGLRVRCGVASGVLAGDCDIRSGAVFHLAKVICDMGNGGQVLTDTATFEGVKDHHEELAAVDHHGWNDRVLVGKASLPSLPATLWCAALPPRGRGPCLGRIPVVHAPHHRACLSETLPFLSKCCTTTALSSVKSANLVCLDMGEWQVPGLDVSAALGPDAPQDPRQAIRALVQTAAGRPGGFAATALAASPAAAAALRDSGLLRVYGMLPPSLAERAKVWGSHLSIKPGWQQTDRGFFDAPAAAASSLTPEDAAHPASDTAMPPVTMVFVAVEGAKALVRARREAEVRAMAGLLRATMLSALEALPGGYLCREQEGEYHGELRYMLAFTSAASALKWCLLVQEAAMYAPWPPSLLALLELSEVHAPGDGALLFRGPRLKMGVCEGVPQSMEPDHMGRADYHGDSINKAARFMDAGAHGGQIACEEGLAEGVFRGWRLGEMMRSDSATPQPPAWAPPGGCHSRGPFDLPVTAEGREESDGGRRSADHSRRLQQEQQQLQQQQQQEQEQPQLQCASAEQQQQKQQLLLLLGRDAPEARQRDDPAAPAQHQSDAALYRPSGRTLSGSQLRRQSSSGTHAGRGADDMAPLASSQSATAVRRVNPVSLGDDVIDARLAAKGGAGAAEDAAQAAKRLSLGAAAPVATTYNTSVRAYHLGTFAFKGSDIVPMVSVTTVALAPRADLLPRDEPKGKGRRVVDKSGLADGAVVALPDVLGSNLRDAFMGMAIGLAASPLTACSGPNGVGSNGAAPLDPAASYTLWLSRELARRRLLIGDKRLVSS